MKTRRWHVRKVYSKKFTRFPKTTGHTDGKKTRSTSRESQSEMFSYLWRTRRPEGHSEVRCLNPISGLIEPGEPGQATDCPTAWCIRWSLKDTTAEVIGKKKTHIVNNMMSLNCFPKLKSLFIWVTHYGVNLTFGTLMHAIFQRKNCKHYILFKWSYYHSSKHKHASFLCKLGSLLFAPYSQNSLLLTLSYNGPLFKIHICVNFIAISSNEDQWVEKENMQWKGKILVECIFLAKANAISKILFAHMYSRYFKVPYVLPRALCFNKRS